VPGLFCIRLVAPLSNGSMSNHHPNSLESRQLLGIMHLNLPLPLPLLPRRLIKKLQFVGLQTPELIRHAHLFVPFFLFGFLLHRETLLR
jgi:hypothetical protein